MRLKSNIFENEQIESSFFDFKWSVLENDTFDEFYLNFGDNKYIICTNAQLDTTSIETSILIKTYEPLPEQYKIKSQLYIVTKVAESVGFQIEYPNIVKVDDGLTYIKGPNTNLPIQDQIKTSMRSGHAPEINGE